MTRSLALKPRPLQGGRSPRRKAIKLTVLGAYGGRLRPYHLTSFLLNDSILLDAGSAAWALPLKAQVRIEALLLTHAHLDHIADLCFLLDNTFGERASPLRVWSLPAVLEALRENIFNDRIWPDVTSIHVNSAPLLETRPMTPGKRERIAGLKVTAHPVDHVVPATGFLLEEEGGAILYTGDTGPTDAIWRAARRAKDLRAIITEVSFPNRMEAVALEAKHYTPGLLRREIAKMPPNLPIYLFHAKPQFVEEVHREVEALGLSRLSWLEQDRTYDFGP